MERYPKAKFIIITILVITVINIAALAIILRTSYQNHHNKEDKRDFAQRGFDYLKEQLNLSESQADLFKIERDTFFKHLNVSFDGLEEKRIEMVKELSTNKPDTAFLYSIADSMGYLHGAIKREVVHHMLKLRSYCNPAQIQKLDSMYNVLIRTDSPWRKKFQKDHKDEYKHD